MADVNKIKLPDNSTVNIKDYRIPGVDSTPTSGSNNVVTSGGIHTAIADTELVVATALNDLNDRVSDLEDGAETLESDSVWEAGTGTNSVIIKGSLGTADGNNSTVEGKGCITGGNYTENTLVVDDADVSSGSYGHAEGRYTISCGVAGSHAEGNKTLASGNASHAEGQLTVASGARSHAEGNNTLASGPNSHAEGWRTIANGTCAHAEGRGSKTNANYSHAEGMCALAEGEGAHAEGMTTRSIGTASHSECGNWWFKVLITGDANATQYEIVEEESTDTPLYELYNSVGSGIFTNLLLKSRLAITGYIADTTTPIISVTSVSLVNNIVHASITVEKTLSNTAMTNASGGRLNMTMAYGNNSHSEASIAWSGNTHAEGFLSTAMGLCSHSEGTRTITNNSFEHAEGSYNISNKASGTYGNAGNTQHSIGIGTASARKNAFEIMQNGDAYLYGIGTYDGTNYSSASSLQTVIGGKQDALVSGTSIKTINNESLLGSGNITISGGGNGGEENVIEAITFNGTSAAIDSSTKTAAITAIVPKVFTGTCATAAATTTKVVTCPEFTAEDLVVGTKIFVTFDNTNSGAVASLKMNVNDTGDKRLQKLKSAAVADLSAVGEIIANVTYLFVYNGSAWVCMTMDYNSNTTYSSMTVAEYEAGTGTTARLITPARLKGAINTWAPDNVFLALYDRTTYAEIKAAYDAGKWVFCEYESNPDSYILPLAYLDPSSNAEQANFSITVGTNEIALAILDGTDDSWTFNTYSTPTESTVSGWGFTKNAGTVTGIKMNGTTNSPSSGIVDLGTVITSHQDISGKQDTIVSNSVITGVSSGGIRAIKGTDNKVYALSTLLTSPGDDYTLARLNDIPTVNNSTITIQKGGSTVDTFTTNASSAKSINIPNELPSYSSSDSGKILSVNSSGNLVWLTPAAIRSGSGTPSNSTGNNGDIYLQTS